MAFSLGDKVSNFGLVCIVVGFHPVTGDPILCEFKGKKPTKATRRWLADSAKVKMVEAAK